MNPCVKYVIIDTLVITFGAVQTVALFSINNVYFVPLAQLNMAALNHTWALVESAF